jgi:hypothetical protein
MSGIPRLVVLVLFIGMLASLASAVFHLSGGTAENSRKMTRAFTWRIALSIVLFVLLMLAWYAGLIKPHGLMLPNPPGPPAQP